MIVLGCIAWSGIISFAPLDTKANGVAFENVMFAGLRFGVQSEQNAVTCVFVYRYVFLQEMLRLCEYIDRVPRFSTFMRKRVWSHVHKFIYSNHFNGLLTCSLHLLDTFVCLTGVFSS